MNILYLTYTGLTEPLGQSQVVTYLNKLSKHHTFHVLSFESSKNKETFPSFTWTNLQRHAGMKGLLTDLIQGRKAVKKLVKEQQFNCIHLRGYQLLPLVLFQRIPFLFDTRGYWVEEQVLRGKIRRYSPIYFLLRFMTWLGKKQSTARTVLTHDAKAQFPDATVIPTCVDTGRFVPGEKKNILVLSGSVNEHYEYKKMLEIAGQFAEYTLRIINKDQHEAIKTLLNEAKISCPIEFHSVPHETIPSLLEDAKAAIFFLNEEPSVKGSFPTKLAESLASGLVILTNEFNSEVRFLEETKTGILYKEYADLERFSSLLTDSSAPERARKEAERFSLEKGVATYLAAYEQINNKV